MIICIDPGNLTGLALFTNRGVLVSAKTLPYIEAMVLLRVQRGGNLVICEKIVAFSNHPAARNRIHRLLAKVREIKPDLVYTAAQWKGSVPKEITKSRVLEVLSKEEIGRIQDNFSDTFDAIGIGLHHLGRLHRMRK